LISERVDNHEQKLKHIIEVLESHNTMLVMDEGKQQQKKEEEMKQMEEIKRRDTRIKWQLGIIIPMGLSVLGYFGYLYIEHIKMEIVTETSKKIDTMVISLKDEISDNTSEQVIRLIEKNYKPSIQ
jgi:predicted negative regulator of RcsB-dependent stress response